MKDKRGLSRFWIFQNQKFVCHRGKLRCTYDKKICPSNFAQFGFRLACWNCEAFIFLEDLCPELNEDTTFLEIFSRPTHLHVWPNGRRRTIILI